MMKTRFLLPLVLLLIFGIYLALPPATPLSPRPELPLPPEATPSRNYLILGFAPYWNLKKITPASLDHLTHFAYFALYLDRVGHVQTHVNRRELEPGYLNYTRLLKSSPTSKPLTLTFMPQDQDALEAILTSPALQAVALDTIADKLKESGATGLNLDFEPLGDTPPSLKNAYTSFVKLLASRLKSQNILLTVSVYASAATRPRIWDLPALAQVVDYFVVMTYDYTMPVTDKSGPNSPLRGSGQLFEHDVVSNIAALTQLVDSRKILLGIPFYGYEWDTVDTTKYSETLGRGSVASLERINQMIDAKTLELVWDRNTLTPYGIASDSGQTSQIYFENNTSIGLKLSFVKAADLGGIAIWALGYEGNNPSLWQTISSLNR